MLHPLCAHYAVHVPNFFKSAGKAVILYQENEVPSMAVRGTSRLSPPILPKIDDGIYDALNEKKQHFSPLKSGHCSLRRSVVS